ncbi:MAG: YjjG family noncanonical pyrimidine nucleotidase, partial [Fusicatenibacter sp.]|nr:YjjG family noncanonical pyrimidine nucleotidase [Fusicatenibacter sp.]
TYTQINESYWRLFEQGRISQSELAVRRFADLYSTLHFEGDAYKANLCYRRCLAEGNQMMPEALSVCQTLSESYTLCLVSNGIAQVQNKRLSGSPITQYLSSVFVSESVGSQKPQKEYFDYVLAQLNIVSSQAFIIGDSLSSDIRGAKNASIDSCWFNPKGNSNPFDDLTPTYEISRLSELYSILL